MKLLLFVLNRDIIEYIYSFIDLQCHVCNIKFNYNNNIFKKQGKFYYCSERCYNYL